MPSIDVIVFDGVDELDALAPFEVFAGAGLDVALVTLDGPRPLTGAHGLTFQATSGLRAAEALLVPGGGWMDRAPEGARAQAHRGALPAAIAAAHARGATIAAVCTGAMLVARTGLLSGRPAVTHASALGELEAAGARVHAEARVVDDGDILTCGGVTSGLDLALHLVERWRGPEAAAAVAGHIEHERRGPVLVASKAARA